MKNIYKYLTVILLVLLFTFLTSCSLFVDGNQSTNGENVNENENYTTENDGTKLVDSLEKTEGIAFYKEREEDAPFVDVSKVIESTKVNRASVSIKISVTDYGVVSGSGTIIDIDDGIDGNDDVFYILTCFHVIDICEKNKNTHTICVYVPDALNRTYADDGYDFDRYSFLGKIGGAVDLDQAVSLVGGDKVSDVALLRLKVPNDVKDEIVKAKIMEPEYSLKLGESVFAIGDARGNHPAWVTQGDVADESYVSSFEGIGNLTLIGINVNIYPGNSGGGLFNMFGELVGMTNGGVAFDAGTDTLATGINYAIPHRITLDKKTDYGFINIAEQLLGTFKEANGTNYGYVSGHHELIGYTVTKGTNKDLSEYVYVSAVTSGSIAESAGFMVGDILNAITINDVKTNITSYEGLTSLLGNVKIGDEIKYNVTRDETVIVGYRWGVPQYTTQTVEKELTYSINQFYFCDTGNYDNILKN